MPEATTRISKALIDVARCFREIGDNFEAIGRALADVGNDAYEVKARMDALIEGFPDAKKRSDEAIKKFRGKKPGKAQS